jgi:chemotaxis signal transduction protein
MLDTLDSQSLHYVPVGVSGQFFALPMSEVAAIRRLGDEDTAAPQVVSDGQTDIPIVDLRRLFFPVKQPSTKRAAYVVVIAVPGLTYAVLVDDVRPARRVAPDDQLRMPPLLAAHRYPFSSVLREAGSLVLMIDASLLAEELRQVKPDVIREQTHGS